MQARSAGVDQVDAQLRGDIDPDAPDLGRVVGGVETIREPSGQRRTAHLGHALDHCLVVDRHDPGQHRLVDAEGGQLVDQADPVLDLEEELRQREVGDRQLVGEMAAVGGPVGRPRVHLRVGRDAHRERTGGDHVVEQVHRVEVVARLVDATCGWVAAEGEDVLDAEFGVVLEQRRDVVAAVTATGEVRHRRPGGLAEHPLDHVAGAVPVGAAGAVGDRHEVGSQRLDRRDRAPERHVRGRGLRWEELERQRPLGREEIRDPGHCTEATDPYLTPAPRHGSLAQWSPPPRPRPGATFRASPNGSRSERGTHVQMVDIWKTVVLQRYAKFDGRAGREEFWWFALATWLLYFVGWIVVGILWGVAAALGVIAFIIMLGLSLALIVPSIAVAIRRLHDTNKSGWWLLIGLIPFGGIVLLVFYILEGTNGPNDHGAVPAPAAVAA